MHLGDKGSKLKLFNGKMIEWYCDHQIVECDIKNAVV